MNQIRTGGRAFLVQVLPEVGLGGWGWVGVHSISNCNCGSLFSWQLKSGGLGQAHQLVGCDQMQKKGQKKKREKEKVRTQWTVKEGQA